MISPKVLRFLAKMSSLGKRDYRVADALAEIPSKERKVDLDGQTVNYIKVGDGPKHILCLPGLVGTIWSDFKPQIDRLDRSKFTVVAWDPPGHGESRPPDKKFTTDFLENDANYAQKLMKVLGISKYSILGWSDGGITGLFLAAKYPKNVEKLVVWGTGTYISPFEQKYVKSIKDLNTWSEEMIEPLVALYTRERLQDMLNRYCNALRQINDKGGDFCTAILQDIECPTFILHGDKDPLLALDHPLNLLNKIKRSKLYRFPHGKHNIHLRYPDDFNKLVSDFILE